MKTKIRRTWTTISLHLQDLQAVAPACARVNRLQRRDKREAQLAQELILRSRRLQSIRPPRRLGGLDFLVFQFLGRFRRIHLIRIHARAAIMSATLMRFPLLGRTRAPILSPIGPRPSLPLLNR